jgi:hypothetical protein
MPEALPPLSLYVFIECSGNSELQSETWAHLHVVSEWERGGGGGQAYLNSVI